MTMKQRKTHHKSRKGCTNCKKRHVKCDEQEPECANCVVRKIPCVYPSRPNSHKGALSPRSQPMITSSISSLNAPLHDHHLGRSTSSAHLSPEHASSAPYGGGGGGGYASPSPYSSANAASSPSISATSSADPGADGRRLVELELMHRWATNTYATLCSLPEDHTMAQSVLPREALRPGNTYLLHAIFALTALDTALHVATDPATVASYFQSAMEYYDSASFALRSKLSAPPPPGEGWVVYLAATANAVYHMAIYGAQIAPTGGSVLSHVGVLFSTWAGAAAVGLSNMAEIVQSPIISVQKMLLRAPPSRDILDEQTRSALARLDALNDAWYGGTSEGSDDHAVYRRAIHCLGTCFVEETYGEVKHYFASFPCSSGKAFGRAVGDGEHMALLILSHWGVLLHQYGRDVWWTSGIGRALVVEVSDLLVQSHLGLTVGGREALAWSRQVVGLGM